MSDLKVAVALSGGVDSAVAAAFMIEKGYEVIGITMAPWLESKSGEVDDAARVAKHLGIEHKVVSFKKEFRDEVVDYFVAEYCRGRTPNPCAVCNPQIKFGGLLQVCDEIGAQMLATGHYAIVTPAKDGSRILLRRGREHGKDQSYFLARLTQKILRRVFFPIGTFHKTKIRELALRFGIPVAEKSESQEACFIPEGKLVEFIEDNLGKTYPAGDLIDKEGQVLGQHRGVIAYTIGQRKGLGIALGRPVYVTNIDGKNNLIQIGENEDLYKKEFIGSEPNWLALSGLDRSISASVRIRYMHRPAAAEVIPLSDNKVKVIFDKEQRAITPGQLAVFYDNDVVIGSAWIESIR